MTREEIIATIPGLPEGWEFKHPWMSCPENGQWYLEENGALQLWEGLKPALCCRWIVRRVPVDHEKARRDALYDALDRIAILSEFTKLRAREEIEAIFKEHPMESKKGE